MLSLSDTSAPCLGIPHALFVQQAFLAYPPSEWDFTLPWPFRAKMAIMAAYFRIGMPSISRFIVQTQHMKQALCERWGIAGDMVEVIPTAVEIPDGIGEGVERRPNSICVIGSPAPHKNLAILPAMMASLLSRVPDVRCYLTLTEKDVPSLCKEARRLGVLDHFVFLGRLTHDDALRLTASCTVSVIPSKLESFGLPYWEGLALGVPMVASNRVFGREICGDAALYADPDRPDEWADRIATIMRDGELAAELGRRAKARFQETAITPTEMAERFIRVVEEVAG